jgi:hypothetical protein
MTINFGHDSHAFLSVLTLVIGADQTGSLRERNFLFTEVRSMPIFENPTAADFGSLLGQVTDTVYSTLADQDGFIAPEGVETLLATVKDALAPEMCKTLVQTAENLCAVDGTGDGESALISQIRGALG